jgi:hypothetical protein
LPELKRLPAANAAFLWDRDNPNDTLSIFRSALNIIECRPESVEGQLLVVTWHEGFETGP